MPKTKKPKISDQPKIVCGETIRRAEIEMLKIYVCKYPEKAKEFISQIQRNLVDNKI